VFFCFFRAKIWPAAAGTGELARDLRDQTHTSKELIPVRNGYNSEASCL
jgi:hypothetical protein